MKLLELTDLHINPKWLESQKPCLNLILTTAKKEKPDAICFSGDIYDRPFYNSEKDCIKFILDYFSELLKIAPIIMITGTLSHDAPGSYEIFKKMGCHVLHPAKPEIINNILFIGLPEIDKSSLMAKKKLSRDAANEFVNQAINKYIKEYWVPVREANKDKPCIFLGHGWFVDNIEKAKQNPMIKNADVIIDNNKLAEIKIDRVILGHSHTPWESKILNGGYIGYMGFDRTPWNNTGFQPGFNVTEIYPNILYGNELRDYNPVNDKLYLTKTTRFDYPVIRKEKIKCYDTSWKIPIKCKNSDLRINLKIKKSDLLKIDLKAEEQKIMSNNNFHSVEIFPDIIKEESQRITHEQAEKLNTLWKKYCFFKNWEENNHESVMLKINELEKNVTSQVQSKEKKEIKLLYLEIKGSIFSIDAQGKNCFSHDFSKDPTGLTLIAGDNGQGKSTFLGFASPYPIFIGWDYRSLKEFFPHGGHIIKRFDINGVIHDHIIQIPEGKKIECFWNIEKIDSTKGDFDDNGNMRPDIIKISFLKAILLKDFMNECEKFFGPISSFISTSFFAQEPWRMKNYVSSLVSSSATELRNAYTEIVGISRAAEKEYAHIKVKELEKEIHDLEIKKNTMSEILADKETVEKERVHLLGIVTTLSNELTDYELQLSEKQKEFDKIEKEYNEQKDIVNKIEFNQDAIKDLQNSKSTIHEKIRRLKKININELQQQLKDNELTKKEIETLREDWQKVNKEKEEIKEKIENHQNIIKRYDNDGYHYNSLISANKINKNKYKSENEILSRPCFHCGKIPHPDNEKIILQNNKIIEDLFNKNKELNKKLKDIERFKKQHENNIADLKSKLPDEQLKIIEDEANKLKLILFDELKIQAIQNSINEYQQIKVYQENYDKLENDIKKITETIKNLESQKNPFVEMEYDKKDKELQELKNQLSEKQKEISSKEGMLKAINTQLEKIKQHEKEITDILKKLDILVVNHEEWEMLEKDMMPHKFPALELQLITEEIDFQVNQKLQGKYIIKTNTQDINKKNEIIDRFDITVYNPKSGIEKSLLAHSPGQRAAYFTEPISQALREKRQQRENIIFMWSIADETDNPIKFERVRDYYEIMNQGLPENHTRFIMSQKSEIYNFIKNTINIEDVGKDI